MWAQAILCVAGAVDATDGVPPNVLVVVGDDISEREMARLATPTFDSLAARGLRFRRAYASPTCSPSRWSLHFGQYHTRDAGPVCDGYDADRAPSHDLVSLPRLFSAAGYHTALFGKWHLGSHPGVERGEAWEEAPRLHGYNTWRAGLPVNVASCGGRDYGYWLRVDDGVSAFSRHYLPDAIRDAFLAWHAEQEESERPWFAMVCFQLPHAPFHATPATPPKHVRRGLTRRRMFEFQVRYLDTMLSELLDALDHERTWVVFLADNGTPPLAVRQGQDPKKVKTTTFEDGIGVPLVVAGPGVPAGVEVSSPVHLVDLLPTFADLVGSELDLEGLDGVSLLPLLDSPEHAVRDYVWSGLSPTSSAPDGDFAVVTQRYKLRRVGGKLELYDLELDPHESENLAGREEHAERVRDLEARLERHLHDL